MQIDCILVFFVSLNNIINENKGVFINKLFENNQDFYPTPEKIAFELFDMFYEKDKNEFAKCKMILEPSAGKGDLIEHLFNFKAD